MTRRLPLLVLIAVLVAACSSTKHVPQPAPSYQPAPIPRVVDEVDETTIRIQDALVTGRRVGRVAGLIAAVFGGGSSETLDETIDRYRRTRDAVTVAAVVVTAAKVAIDEAEVERELDTQVDLLCELDGVEVTRLSSSQLDIRFTNDPSDATLTAVANALLARGARAIAVEGPGQSSLEIRDALIALGVEPAIISAHRKNDLSGVVLRVTV